MSATADRVRAIVAPLLTDPEVVLYDVEYTGGTLRVVLDRPGGVDMGTITEVTRAVSAALDEADLVPSAYTLEVSSPGLERALRTPEHFAGALGREVRVKLRPGVEGDRRAAGVLSAADDTTVTVTDAAGAERVLRIEDITKANVHVDWAPPPKPGSAAAKAARDRSPGAPSQSGTPRPSSTQSEATP
jgi:ribosome maturation factor RimP